ncbi:helix-turn-helix domain-containing protein [Citricoccus nitrophenolicus]|uniref:helix-turn-helix domain-containing protein n=1 Tax=Citricoccus nitrophenolicus TaxID=863575 RepID=UPI0031E85F17
MRTRPEYEKYLRDLLDRSGAAIAAREKEQSRPGFPSFSREVGSWELSSRVTVLPDEILNCKDGKQLNRGATPRAMLAALGYHFNLKEGYAWPTQEYLTKTFNMDVKTIRAAVRQLEEVGLLGYVPGYKTRKASYASRYYFLFHEKSLSDFQAHRARIAEALRRLTDEGVLPSDEYLAGMEEEEPMGAVPGIEPPF